MEDDPRDPRDPRDPLDALIAALAAALDAGTLLRLVLARPRDPSHAARVAVRPLQLKGQPVLSFVHSHATRDITKNLSPAEGLREVRALLETGFAHAQLSTTTDELRLMVSKKGRRTLLRGKAAGARSAAPRATHDHEKQRFLDLDRAFLAALGVTTAEHTLVPAMARKWKQINKFIEVLDHALELAALKQAPRVDVVDFGSGKGYLTFAAHDYLRATLGLPAQVAGVELRADMVELCNGAVRRLGLDGLAFEQGDVRSVVPAKVDIMIALHACDTATDHAIHTGIAAGAAIIMCAPCCHKELRPQLLSPHPMRPILKHGVHMGQLAEILTDGLRAMLLEACGYETQVFEFVALEHTRKNKMILAVKRGAPRDGAAVWQQVRDVKQVYGIRDQCLEALLRSDGRAG